MNIHIRLIPSLFLVLFVWVQEASASNTSYCTIAREITQKGVDLFADQPEKGLQALIKARESCGTDLAVGYNLGLAYYLSGRLQEARDVWEAVYAMHPNDYKTIANLSWLRFEMGDDEGAHILSFNGSIQFPKSVALAHTKLYALFRMGRYLEAYDWLLHPTFETPQLEEWRTSAAEYVAETLWQQFNRGERMNALRQVVNFLVKEYPKELIFSRTKDQLVMADIDPDAEIPYPVFLPHQVWPKSGDVDNRRDELDGRLQAIPVLQPWRKREDAYALFIGLTRYRRLPARYFGARDAAHMHQLLTRRGEFIDDAQHVRLLLDRDATRANILRDLEWAISRGRTNPNAKIVIYLAGLGYGWNTGKDALLVPYEGVRGRISPDTAVSLTQLRKSLDALPNKEVVVVVDTCFGNDSVCGAGDAIRGTEVRSSLLAGKGVWAVSAVTGPLTFHRSGRQSAFTFFMLEGLLGKADGVGAGSAVGSLDGWVSLSEAFHYARKRQAAQDLATDAFLSRDGEEVRLTRIGGEQ